MPLTPEQKRQAQEILKLYDNDPQGKQEFLNGIRSKGYTEMDLPELAQMGPSEGFSFGGALGALTSGVVEGFSGLTPEQAIDRPQAQSGLNVDVPFLGQVDPVRAAGQVAGSIYSPVQKVKIAKWGLGFVLRNFGPSAVSALQDATDPGTEEVAWDDVVRLFGADAAGAIIGKGIGKASVAKKAIGRMRNPADAAPSAPKPSVDTDIADFTKRQNTQMLEDDLMGRNIGTLQQQIPPLNVPQDARLYQMPTSAQVQSATGPAPRQLPQAQPSSLPYLPQSTVNTASREAGAIQSVLAREVPKESAALNRIQQKGKTAKELKSSPEPPKSKTVSTNELMEGSQFIDENGKFMEVIERPKGRKQPLKVRDIASGKVKTLVRSTDKKVKKIIDIQPTNLDFLFGAQ